MTISTDKRGRESKKFLMTAAALACVTGLSAASIVAAALVPTIPAALFTALGASFVTIGGFVGVYCHRQGKIDEAAVKVP